MVYLISYLETYTGISCHFYDFIKCFNVLLHLGLLYWNVTMRLERILVWRFMVSCCGNGSWCGCIARRIWNNHIWYLENWLWEVFMWCYMHYPLIYCLCRTMGPWVKVPKASRKTLWCECMGLVLPLGF